MISENLHNHCFSRAFLPTSVANHIKKSIKRQDSACGVGEKHEADTSIKFQARSTSASADSLKEIFA